MKRPLLSLFICVLAAGPLTAGDAEVKQTIAYLKKLQTPSGGFVATAAQRATTVMPTLRSTTTAIRALHYFGAETPNPKDCQGFVDACFFPESGGFGETPKAKPDVLATAVGLMAVVELKMPTEKYTAGAIKYMNDHAKTFEDIRIAAAGLESVRQKSALNDAWIKDILKLQNQDGTFGKGPGQARATGGSVAALLRLGAKPADTALVLKVLKAGQRQNGGYGKDDDAVASDLETTYRVMRCFVMLKARPNDVAGIRSFIAKCRNADGGYGTAPGQPSSVGGTYFAAIIMHWLKS